MPGQTETSEAQAADEQMRLASAHLERGDSAQALAALRRAIELRPGLTAAHKNLAAVLAGDGRVEEARAVLRRAVEAVPNEAGLWLRLAALETSLGDASAALQCLARAAACRPTSAAAWRDIGQAYAEHWRHAEADRALARAAELEPGAAATESLAALVKQELGDTAGALQALARAGARDSGDLRVALAERLMLPQVYESEADLARWRGRYTAGLERTTQEIDRWLARAEDVFDLNRHNFLLAYQGEDDTALQAGYSSLIAALAGAARPQWRERRPIRFDGARRLRVGFAGGIFRDCTAGRYFERWITRLDRARFERFVYHTGSVSDAFTRRIAATAERFATVRSGVRDTASRILADELDVLVYPEVGMSAITYLLAALRLAPVQAAGWGHPVTTGSDAIDFYFTCAAMEPPEAPRHYVERLIALPGLGVDYPMPAEPPPGARADIGLPEDRRIYVCAQSLFKVHPETDALLAGILAADESAVLVFFQAMARGVTEAFAARLQRALASRGIAPRGQIKFLPRMDGAHFRRVLALADVVLDTPRWSGGNTSLDAFAAGVPVVALPGRFMRGRQTAAMLGMMAMPELAARDAGDYVRIAVDVARDRDRNAALRRAIAERRSAMFDRSEPVEAFAAALLRIGAGYT